MDFKGKCETEIHYEKHLKKEKRDIPFKSEINSKQTDYILAVFYLDLRLQDDYDHVHDQQND